MNHARRDLCGGCAEMRIPTAIGPRDSSDRSVQLIGLTFRRAELEGQSKLCQVGPCKSDLLKEYASDLNLFGIYERSPDFS